MANRMIDGPIIPDGWRVEGVQYHRGLGYWALNVFEILAALIPAPVTSTRRAGSPADVTYTMRRDRDGAIRNIRLSGDHAPGALAEEIARIEREGAE